jgi:Kef-type K+ transport system membrane component KefB
LIESTQSLLWLAIVLLAARAATWVERVGQPAVLGEILAGVALGGLCTAGAGWLEPARTDPALAWLAELGVVILLFQVALELDLEALRTAGARAVAVAAIGVAVPVALGTTLAGPLLMPGLPPAGRLFVGATLAATSVGITARILRDLGELGHPASGIILSAAVVDDILGLLLLAGVSAVARDGSAGATEMAAIGARTSGFLIVVAVGLWIAGRLGRRAAFERYASTTLSVGALAFCFAMAWVAARCGLAAIVGAFGAGLTVRRALKAPAEPPLSAPSSALQRLDASIGPIGALVVPVFFVHTGMQARLSALGDPRLVWAVLAIGTVAVLGKLVAGLAAGRGNRLRVAWGMVPRGEVGLVFAASGRSLGVLPDEAFTLVVSVVLFTTLVTPPALGATIRRDRARAEACRQTEAAAGRDRH